MHVSFVAAADEKNPLSIAVQKELERRYARSVKRFAAATSTAALLELWQQAVAEGEVQGAFWAVMTHGLADVEVRTRAFEDVHMLSHQIGAGLRADLSALTKARKDLAQLRHDSESEARRQARRLQAKITEIEHLRERVAQLESIEQAYEAARERLRELEDGRELRALRAQVATLEQDNERQGRRLADAELRANALETGLGSAESEIVDLTAQLSEQAQACEALERLVGMGADAVGCSAKDCESCGVDDDRVLDLDLAGRRILCVGGRSDLAPRYRDLVQRCNGELIRHDGGLEDSQQRLEAVLASADAVICPADAVSHNAYSRTKRFCKRMGKPCVLVPRSSVGAFAQALTALADPPGQQALQGPFSLDNERMLRERQAA
ncbi:DUF2325 domain-containing protein [Lamprobacter modestohalophilus]|uniref:DUF2325 domain-containing protein n=1 Tax=Lamprobacter modestohalophilus TaxID=1064514 RepID=UPI002ADEF50A|nr:DUF2325 domain-containing protein [Lamprobacter modestohalophilus]MEA1051856.1 DUF2325 domain-containing protein [Lamprobacter modestohalophilus]